MKPKLSKTKGRVIVGSSAVLGVGLSGTSFHLSQNYFNLLSARKIQRYVRKCKATRFADFFLWAFIAEFVIFTGCNVHAMAKEPPYVLSNPRTPISYFIPRLKEKVMDLAVPCVSQSSQERVNLSTKQSATIRGNLSNVNTITNESTNQSEQNARDDVLTYRQGFWLLVCAIIGFWIGYWLPTPNAADHRLPPETKL